MKNKGLRKTTLLLASMMTMMAGAIVSPSIPQITEVFKEVENVELLTRLILTLPALFIAIFAPLFGALSDRIGRKKILIFSLILYAFGGVSGFFLNNIYLILLGRVFLGIAVGGIMTIVVSLIGDYFQGKERHSFTGMQGAFTGIGGVVFISVAGILADIQWQMPFLIYLFSVPVLLLAIFFIDEPEKHEKPEQNGENGSLYNKLIVFAIYCLAFFGIVCFYIIPVQIPFYLKGFTGITSTQIGYAIAISTVTSSLMSMNYGRIKTLISFKKIYQFAFFFMGSGYLIIFLTNSYAFTLVGLAVSGLGTGLFMPTGNLWIMSITPAHIRGTLIGRLSTASFLGMFFSPIILQPIIKYSNISTLFLVAAVMLFVVSTSLFLLKAPKKVESSSS